MYFLITDSVNCCELIVTHLFYQPFKLPANFAFTVFNGFPDLPHVGQNDTGDPDSATGSKTE